MQPSMSYCWPMNAGQAFSLSETAGALPWHRISLATLERNSVRLKSQKRFRVISLTDSVPSITAWANDHGYEHVFAEQLENLVESEDVVFAISGSGNSPNVLRALEVAKDHGARTIGLTGFEGGKMKNLCDVCVILPSDNMEVIEDFHLSMTHAISSVIRRRIFEGAPSRR